jgi:uncharacterized cupredoxin-like copper-binding protein
MGALAFASCGSAGSAHPSGPGMMGGSSAGSAAAGGMATGGSDYHFGRLTCSAPQSLPGRIVNVTLADQGMTQMMGGTAPMGVRMMLRATPDIVAAGQIALVASNMGWRSHELVVLPLAAGATAGQRVSGGDGKVTETGSLGEASNSCRSGAGAGITVGTVSWTTLTLPPGHYELICNLPNHYADGMYQELDVT